MKGKEPKKLGNRAEFPAPKPEELAVERAIETSVTELHLGRYPIFCITTSKPTDTRLTYREKFKINGVEIRKEWSIQVSSHYGWPGEHDAEVWRSIRHIAELRAKAGCLANPVETTLEEIRDHMSSKSKGGQQRKAIVRSLHCLVSVSIEMNYWYDAAKRNWDMAHFPLLAGITLTQRDLPNGKKIIEKVLVGFEPRVFVNLQKRYVRPLDKGFLDTKLARWLSKRLYEFLGPKFYGLRKKGVPYRTRYSRLCGLLGTKQQRYLSYAKNILKPAHEELQIHGFIAKVEWFPILRESNDWVMHYWPGPRAKAEWKKEFWWKDQEILEPIYVEELPAIASEPVYVEEPPDESTITVDVITEEAPDRIEQLPIFVEEPPDYSELLKPPKQAKAKPSPAKAKAVITVPAEVIPPPKLAPATPAPPEPEEDSYAKDAIWAFEIASGKHRKLSKLTAAEQKRLAEWKTQGITPPDIEAGTKTAIAKASEQARASGKPPREIVSLAYVNGYVLDAALKRQEMERLVQSSLSKARAFQSQELRELEAQIKGKLQGKPGGKGFYQDFIEPLILVNAQGGFAVLVSPIQDCASFFLKQDWLKPIVEAVGFPAYVTWVVEWAYGYEWRNKLGQV